MRILLLILYSSVLCAKYSVDFDTAMVFHKNDAFAKKRLKKKKNPITKFCRKLYNKNNLDQLSPKEDTIIPKIVHLIWVGPHKPPAIFDACLESIRTYLPDWECKLWTDKEVRKMKLFNQKYYDKEKNYGAKADILRYELLYKFGGVYLDVDMVLLQPLDILHHTYEFYTCLMPSWTSDVIANGVIGCIPKHPIMKHCIKAIKDHQHLRSVIQRTGPMHFEQSFHKIAKKLMHKRIIALPRSFFLPLDKSDLLLSIEQQEACIRPESFAAHYWSDSWDIHYPRNNRENSGDVEAKRADISRNKRHKG